MKRLDGVLDAQVNFGAAKITVVGNASVEAIEKAGAFDNLKLRDEKEQKVEREPFWKQKENIKVYISALLLIISWLLGEQFGEGHIVPTIGYAASILIGGYYIVYKRV